MNQNKTNAANGLRALIDELYAKISTVISTIGSVSGTVQKIEQTFTLAQLQAAGAVGTASFDVGALLPANARVLATEVEVDTPLSASAPYTSSTLTIESTSDAGAGNFGTALQSGTGLNQSIIGAAGLYGWALGGFAAQTFPNNAYITRGGQQMQVTITFGAGTTFNLLTAGQIVVRVFYAVVP